MALISINLEAPQGDDLPWVAEFLEQDEENEDVVTLVTQVIKTPKGFLIITELFKGFLYKDSAIYNFLSEAITTWVSNSTINYPLYAKPLNSGKLNLAIDDEEEPTVWICDQKNKKWSQKRKKGKDDGLKVQASNPFLPTPSPTMNGKKGKTNSGYTADTVAQS